MSGHRPTKILTESASNHSLIANVLRMTGVGSSTSRVSYSSDLLPGLAWEIVDSGDQPMTWQTKGDEVIHILYAADEPGCRIEFDGFTMPIAPGDTVRIGSNSEDVQLSDGVLALRVLSDRGSSSRGEPPSHGIESFDGFNRQTTYATGSEIALERWKLSTPLDLDLVRTAALVVLYGNISVVKSGSVDTLGPGESIVYTNDILRLVPDGLAYIAVVRRPDL
jgi:hypothetical protein